MLKVRSDIFISRGAEEMKKHQVCKLFLVASLTVLLCAACAKKPATTTMDDDYGSAAGTAGAPGLDAPEYDAIDETRIAEEGADAALLPGMGEEISGLERIYFKFDQYTLTPEARDILARNAQFLKANSGIRIIIEGHCDERGADEYNLALGERRARAVKKYLTSLGVPAERMSVISYGEELPLDPHGTEEAWAKNRRADFKQVR
jgi:peptidoglycan-associated lipoprotein